MKHVSKWVQAAFTAASLFTIPAAQGAETISVPMHRDGGNWFVPITFNGHTDQCLIDTGADDVLIPMAWELDPKWHIGFQPRSYAHMITAMAGETTVPKGILPLVAVGPAVEQDVDALVSNGQLCLLGQSFLQRFASATLDFVNRRLLLVRQ